MYIKLAKECSNLTKRYQVTLKEDIAQKLEELANELGLSKSAVITLALQMYDEEKKA